MNITKLIPFPLLLVSVMQAQLTATAQQRLEIKIVSEHTIDPKLKEVVTNVVTAYDRKYTLGFPVLTVVDEKEFESTKRSDGRTQLVVSYAKPQQIHLNFSLSPSGLTNALAHELFHTAAPKWLRDIPGGLRIGKYNYPYVHGLGLAERQVDGRDVGISSIEEGAAEFCALAFHPGYGVATGFGSPEYSAWGTFFKRMADFGWFSAQDIIEFQKKNGLPELCARILRKSSASDDDIRFLAEVFFHVQTTPLNINLALEKIIEKRGETGKYQLK